MTPGSNLVFVLVFVTIPSIVVELIFTVFFEMEYMLKSYILHGQERHGAAIRIQIAAREFLARKRMERSTSGLPSGPLLDLQAKTNTLTACCRNLSSWWRKNIEEILRVAVAATSALSEIARFVCRGERPAGQAERSCVR